MIKTRIITVKSIENEEILMAITMKKKNNYNSINENNRNNDDENENQN